MHDIRAVLDAADEEVHAVRLDPDGEENIGELPDPRTVEPAFRRTDLASVHDELDGAGAAETVAIGYCIGGTLLADYQLRAQRDPHLDGFDAAVVLDAPVGIETDHQLVRVEDYPYDDLAGFYDAGIPASQSIDVPRAVVPGTDHLWRDIPDDLGQAVYETVDRMAEGRRPAAAIDMVTGRYDGIEPVGDRAYPADGSDGGPGTGGRP